jgi:penicillin-binding protein 1C
MPPLRSIRARYVGWLATLLALPLLVFLALPPALLQGIAFSRAVYDRNEVLMRLTLSSDDKYRLYVPLSDISPLLVQAVLLHEDRYFYDHPGVNPVALARALWHHVAGGGRGGASTLTMQLARLRYGIDSRTIPGKLWQMLEAVRIELHYSKKEILEAYLNLAPYGTNIEGAGAASFIYFGRPAATLSLPEALTLAVVPQSPAKRTPGRNAATNHALLQARQKMYAVWLGSHPDDTRYAAFISRPIHYGSKHDLPFIAPQFSARLLKERHDGSITSTLDSVLQHQLAGLAHQYVLHGAQLGIANASSLLIDTRNMEVLASVGSADYFNAAREGMIDGTRARRSPGSALKPFIYALAFDQGVIHPLSLMRDAPITFAIYAPENFDHHYEGPLSAHDALIRSRNIPALWLADHIHHPDFYDFLVAAGIGHLKPKKTYGLSLALGGEEVTMEELVQLYAMLANDGELKSLRRTLQDAPGIPKRLLSPEAAFMTLDILKDTVPPGGSAVADTLPLPVYWKTGTSAGLRDAWSVGVFGPYALAVWVGDFRGSTRGQYIGIASAAPLFFEMMRTVSAREHPRDLIAEKPPHLRLVRHLACSDTGDVDTRYCPSREPVWLIPGVSPITPTGIYRRVLVNRNTGNLACVYMPDVTDYRIVQFWPSELTDVFAKAGIVKTPPPPWDKGCDPGELSQPETAAVEITSPARGLIYHLRDGADNRLPLKASFSDGAHTAFWFVGNVPLVRTKAGETAFWPLRRGSYTLRVIDDASHAASRRVVVE